MKKYYKGYFFSNHNNQYVKEVMENGKIEYHPEKPMYCTSHGLETQIREQLYSKADEYGYYTIFMSLVCIKKPV